MAKIYEFTEHNLTISGERNDMIALAEHLRNAEGTLGDIRYQIEYAFDIDGVRSENSGDERRFDPDYADGYLKDVRPDKWYGVVTVIHNDGRVSSNIVNCVESEEKPENSYRSDCRKDVYTDWFASYEEAADFVQKARKA